METLSFSVKVNSQLCALATINATYHVHFEPQKVDKPFCTNSVWVFYDGVFGEVATSWSGKNNIRVFVEAGFHRMPVGKRIAMK